MKPFQAWKVENKLVEHHGISRNIKNCSGMYIYPSTPGSVEKLKYMWSKLVL
jgi:hypothetical protein